MIEHTTIRALLLVLLGLVFGQCLNDVRNGRAEVSACLDDTAAVCGRCWGTDRSDETGPDLRAMDARERTLRRHLLVAVEALRAAGAADDVIRPLVKAAGR